MRLAFVSSNRIPGVGGLSSYVESLAPAVRRHGHDVSVVSLADAKPGWVRWFVERPGYAFDYLGAGLGLRWTYPRVEALLARRLRRLHARAPLDVVMPQDPVAFRAVERAFPTRRPTVVGTLHGYLVYEHLADKTLRAGRTEARLWAKERAYYTGADLLIAVDTRLRDHAVAYGAPATRVRVMKNFVDTEWFSPAPPAGDRWPGRWIVLCPRRLVAKNGVVFAARAAALLEAPHHLVIAGDGPDRPNVEASLPKNAEILGYVPHDQLPDLMRRADVVVVPSVHEKGVEEATSVSAIEAMATGRPVVVCAVGGLRELVDDGTNGLVVPERDPAALADAIRRLTAEPELARRLAAQARRDAVNHFGLDRRVRDYLAYIDEARGGRH